MILGYDTAWVPPHCGMVPSGLEEDCVYDTKRIVVLRRVQVERVHRGVRRRRAHAPAHARDAADERRGLGSFYITPLFLNALIYNALIYGAR